MKKVLPKKADYGTSSGKANPRYIGPFQAVKNEKNNSFKLYDKQNKFCFECPIQDLKKLQILNKSLLLDMTPDVRKELSDIYTFDPSIEIPSDGNLLSIDKTNLTSEKEVDQIVSTEIIKLIVIHNPLDIMLANPMVTTLTKSRSKKLTKEAKEQLQISKEMDAIKNNPVMIPSNNNRGPGKRVIKNPNIPLQNGFKYALQEISMVLDHFSYLESKL